MRVLPEMSDNMKYLEQLTSSNGETWIEVSGRWIKVYPEITSLVAGEQVITLATVKGTTPIKKLGHWLRRIW